MIEVSDFHKRYGSNVAVECSTFQVRPGEILGLIGPNGAGKTTTLRAIAGIIPPSNGRLTVAGHDVNGAPVAAKRQLAYVPDDPSLFEALTVWEHLQFIAQAYRLDSYNEKATELLDVFELGERRNTVAQELSRGMRQKVAICCAYLHDPKAILFDEPLTGLDPQAIRTLKKRIRQSAETGTAVIISSHLLALVEDLCTHLLILDQGTQMYCGAISEVRAAFDDLSGSETLEEVFFRAISRGDSTLQAAG